MVNVLVVYTSSFGNTQRMAEAVVKGVGSVPDCQAVLKRPEEAIADDAREAHAIVVGSPMRHRSADARIKQFIENVFERLWLTDDLVGKVGGVFTVGGGYGDCGAGVEIAQLGILAAMAGCGMILVSFPKTTPGADVAGSHWGPHGRSGGPDMEPVGVNERMLEAAFHHGANVARVAASLADKDLLAKGNVAPPPHILKLFEGLATGMKPA